MISFYQLDLLTTVCFFTPNLMSCLIFQKELISGDQNGNIRVWDLAANTCSCDLVSPRSRFLVLLEEEKQKTKIDVLVPFIQVPEVDTAVRSLTVMWDGSMVVAANNRGTCYVWRLLKGTQVSQFC